MLDAGAISDYPEAKACSVSVGDRDVVVIRWHGEFYASSGNCPHMMAQLRHGTVEAALSADGVGAFCADHTRPVLVCPWHGWQFDLQTGQSLADPKVRMRTFRTQCQNGRLLIDLHKP